MENLKFWGRVKEIASSCKTLSKMKTPNKDGFNTEFQPNTEGANIGNTM